MEALQIQMLGEFVISAQNVRISDRDNRSRKLWILLAYLIYHRRRTVTQEELIRLLWNEAEEGKNPAGALKTTFHRVRAMLDRLWPEAGRQLILYQNGGYIWNSDIPVSVDIDQFEYLYSNTTDEKEQYWQGYTAVLLYKGDFLSKLSAENWVIPIAAYYHNCYMKLLLDLLPKMLQQKQYDEAARLCRLASTVEPYEENIYYYWMRSLLEVGEHKDAAKIYEQFKKRLYLDFGMEPNEDIRELYHKAIKTDNGHFISIEDIIHQLKEENEKKGALICEYDFFRVLYRAMVRYMVRSGIVVHIALIAVESVKDEVFSPCKLQKVMNLLEEQLRLSLRIEDTAARCSNSQYIVMLPQTDYENSCMVCERVVKSYYRRHPHSDVDIKYTVYPMQPD